jgi:hypothetical protein
VPHVQSTTEGIEGVRGATGTEVLVVSHERREVCVAVLVFDAPAHRHASCQLVISAAHLRRASRRRPIPPHGRPLTRQRQVSGFVRREPRRSPKRSPDPDPREGWSRRSQAVPVAIAPMRHRVTDGGHEEVGSCRAVDFVPNHDAGRATRPVPTRDAVNRRWAAGTGRLIACDMGHLQAARGAAKPAPSAADRAAWGPGRRIARRATGAGTDEGGGLGASSSRTALESQSPHVDFHEIGKPR